MTPCFVELTTVFKLTIGTLTIGTLSASAFEALMHDYLLDLQIRLERQFCMCVYTQDNNVRL